MNRRPLRGDDGTIIPLMLAFMFIASALLLVVIDSTVLFLRSRSLSTTADGAALAAAQQVDKDIVYNGEGAIERDLPLLQADAESAVLAYLAGTNAATRIGGFDAGATRVVVDGTRVTVVLGANVRVPLATRIVATSGIAVKSSATAVLRCDTPAGNCA